MSRTRVVITGVAGVTPLANDIETTWRRLIAGESGIAPITLFDTTQYDSRIAGEVKNFDPEAYMPAKQARRMDRFTQFAVASAKMLLEDASLTVSDDNASDIGIILGIGLGGLQTIEAYHSKLLAGGPGKVSPFMIPMLISNMGPGQIAIMTGIKGPNVVTTTACASALHGIGSAFSEILLGRISGAITGGVEATVTPLGVAGFTSLKALSTHYNDTPQQASRPFDGERDGFVIGEGAGLLYIETLESAQRRGAKIYAELLGYGASDDAYHMTAPSGDGEGQGCRHRSRSHRPHQRARHVHEAERRYRNQGHQGRVRRACFQNQNFRHQVHDRPSARRVRRYRNRLHGAGPVPSDRARHHQPDPPRSGMRSGLHGRRFRAALV